MPHTRNSLPQLNVYSRIWTVTSIVMILRSSGIHLTNVFPKFLSLHSTVATSSSCVANHWPPNSFLNLGNRRSLLNSRSSKYGVCSNTLSIKNFIIFRCSSLDGAFVVSMVAIYILIWLPISYTSSLLPPHLAQQWLVTLLPGSMFGRLYGDARMPNWSHWHRTPLPGIATTGLHRDTAARLREKNTRQNFLNVPHICQKFIKADEKLPQKF